MAEFHQSAPFLNQLDAGGNRCSSPDNQSPEVLLCDLEFSQLNAGTDSCEKSDRASVPDSKMAETKLVDKRIHDRIVNSDRQNSGKHAQEILPKVIEEQASPESEGFEGSCGDIMPNILGRDEDAQLHMLQVSCGAS